MNHGLNSKLQKVKDHLKMQRKVLEERKREIETLRGWDAVSHEATCQTSQTKTPSKPVFTFKPPGKSNAADSATLTPTPSSKRGTPSSSRKRHASIIEAKSRQLVEEEGHTFRQQQTKQQPLPVGKGTWHQDESTDGGAEKSPKPHGTGLVGVPVPDAKWYEERGVVLGGVGQAKREKRRVHFDAEAIILNAALEGELDLLKECIQKVIEFQLH